MPSAGGRKPNIVPLLPKVLASRAFGKGFATRIFLGSEAFVERFAQGSRPLDKLREVPVRNAVPLRSLSGTRNAPTPSSGKRWLVPS